MPSTLDVSKFPTSPFVSSASGVISRVMAPWHEVSATACIITLLGLASVGAEFPPVITYPNLENRSHLFIVAPPSNDVILNCNATDADPNKDFVWRKNKTHPLPPGWRPRGEIPSSNQSSLRAPFSANSITLPAAEISGNPSSLDGSYECVVSNTAGVAVSAPVSINFARIVYPEYPGTLSIEGHIGSTLRIPCSNSKEPIKFYPSAMSIGVQVTWALKKPSGDSIPLGYEYNNRTMVNELGNLYIRKLMPSDKTSPGHTITCTIFNPMAEGSGRTTVGSYTLRLLGAYGYPLDAKLVYKTPDFAVAEGASFFLSCIFEDVGEEHFGHPGFITPGPAKFSFVNGGIYVNNVGPRDSGDYRCKHNGARRVLEEVIRVTVIPYPLTAEMVDKYAPIGSLVDITCQTRADNAATFRWFLNDEEIVNGTEYHVRTGTSSSVLSILNSTVSDSGVIGCTATNEIGTTRMNSRFIVYEPASIKMNQSKGVIKDGKQYMVFRCYYNLDVRAGNYIVYFTISNRNGRIGNTTNDEFFGIKRPAVVREQDGGTVLHLAHDSYEGRNILVNCTCHVEYKILNLALSVSAATPMNTERQTSTVTFRVTSTASMKTPTTFGKVGQNSTVSTSRKLADVTPVAIVDALQWWVILAIVLSLVVVIVLVTMLSLRLMKKKDMAKAKVSLTTDYAEATKPYQGKSSANEQSQPLTINEPEANKPSQGQSLTNEQSLPLITNEPEATKASMAKSSTNEQSQPPITDGSEATKPSRRKSSTNQQSQLVITAESEATKTSLAKSSANEQSQPQTIIEFEAIMPSRRKSSTHQSTPTKPTEPMQPLTIDEPEENKLSRRKSSTHQSTQIKPDEQSQPLVTSKHKATKPIRRKSSTHQSTQTKPDEESQPPVTSKSEATKPRVRKSSTSKTKLKESNEQSQPLVTSKPEATKPSRRQSSTKKPKQGKSDEQSQPLITAEPEAAKPSPEKSSTKKKNEE